MKKCENCEEEHGGEYGSGRFCSNKCARGFSTKANRSSISEKTSLTLQLKLNNGLTTQQTTQRKIANKHAAYIRETEITSLYDLSSRTVQKILKRLNLPCSNCGWHETDVVCDIHHIIEKKNGGTNEHNNLTYICPNCHRLVHSKKLDSKLLINLQDYIGDTWKQYYYVKNGKLDKVDS
jgi:5-methylcytosine-specific restriction endonuclease McrA